MFRTKLLLSVWLLLICFAVSLSAQQAAPAAASAVVPPVIKFSGVLTDVNNKALTGTVGVTFSLYEEAQGGAALWVETQNVTPDKTGHYSVILGSTTSQGIPADLFASGEARWLGVQAQGQTEQPRTLLMSVPYALKALDAETVGGKPASSFMLTPQAGGKSAVLPPGTITGSGTADYIPMFTGATTIGNSHIFQTVGGNVGIGTTAPAAKLDVKGTEDVRNTLTLFPSGTNPALSVHGTALEVSGTGLVTFVSGQTFPGAGTVTSVGSGAGLTGGPITGSGTLSIASRGVSNSMLANPSLTVAAGTDLTGGGSVALGATTTLNLDTTKVPQLNSANTFTGNQTVNGSLSAGPISATTASTTAPAVTATDASGSGSNSGVYGTSANGLGVYGASAEGYGVQGISTNGIGTYASGGGYGVYGTSANGLGVYGGSGSGVGLYGISNSSYGVYGASNESDAVLGEGVNGVVGRATTGYGVYGSSSDGDGVYGIGPTFGVEGQSSSTSGSGGGFSNSTTGDALFTYNGSGGYAAFFEGNVDVDGNLSKAGGSFKIDHPLDPANKYLYHSFVESPDMKNIYDGVATLNANGQATIEMPDWFGVLNRDFRYQLTCIGGFAPVYIAEELADNQFKIGGGRAGMRVSWQITGIRQDAWANAHRIPVEQEKEAKLKGFYLHPELYGAPAEKQIQWARHPEMMKKLLQNQEQMKEQQARLTESPAIAGPTRLVPPPILEKPAPPIPPAALPRRATK